MHRADDHRVAAVGEHPREVAGDAAAGDVRERVHIGVASHAQLAGA